MKEWLIIIEKILFEVCIKLLRQSIVFAGRFVNFNLTRQTASVKWF